MIRRTLAPVFGLLAAACSPLGTFAALVPEDRGVRLVADGVPYGAGPRRRMDVFAPEGPSTAARPVILFFYGGSWASGSRSQYRWVARALGCGDDLTVEGFSRGEKSDSLLAFEDRRWMSTRFGMTSGNG